MSKRDDHFRSTMATAITDETTYTSGEFLTYLDELDKDNQTMGKHNKNSVPTEKMFTLEDVDQMTITQFIEGQRRGMYQCHGVFSDSIARLRQSLDDVWAIEYTGVITSDKEARASELTFAINTLTTLHDMFQGEYDTRIDKLNKESWEDYV
jgi:hypothetical protein